MLVHTTSDNFPSDYVSIRLLVIHHYYLCQCEIQFQFNIIIMDMKMHILIFFFISMLVGKEKGEIVVWTRNSYKEMSEVVKLENEIVILGNVFEIVSRDDHTKDYANLLN